jgi:hypothetical protein
MNNRANPRISRFSLDFEVESVSENFLQCADLSRLQAKDKTL